MLIAQALIEPARSSSSRSLHVVLSLPIEQIADDFVRRGSANAVTDTTAGNRLPSLRT